MSPLLLPPVLAMFGWSGVALPAAPQLLGWTLFVHPWVIPAGSRLWWFLPLSLAVALTYRLTRIHDGERVLWPTLRIFINVVIGMWLLAIAVYVVHELVLRSY